MCPAIVDTKTKKIMGCKNLFELEHEKAHIQFSESEFGMNLLYFQELCIPLVITCILLSILGLKFFNIFSGVLILVYWGIMVYEESWCNHVAQEKTIEEESKTI